MRIAADGMLVIHLLQPSFAPIIPRRVARSSINMSIELHPRVIHLVELTIISIMNPTERAESDFIVPSGSLGGTRPPDIRRKGITQLSANAQALLLELYSGGRKASPAIMLCSQVRWKVRQSNHIKYQEGQNDLQR